MNDNKPVATHRYDAKRAPRVDGSIVQAMRSGGSLRPVLDSSLSAGDLSRWFSEQPETKTATMSREGFLSSVLPSLCQWVGAKEIGLVSSLDGRWQCEAAWADRCTAAKQKEAVGRDPAAAESSSAACSLAESLPGDLIAEAVDSGELLTGPSGLLVLPLSTTAESDDGQVPGRTSALVLRGSFAAETRSIVVAAGGWIGQALQAIESRRRQDRRVKQLRRLLEASASWQKFDDDDELLAAIADTACELLTCERASIFLWDRRRNVLVGRPALGIEGGRLEVADDAGIVGEVLRHGEACFWTDKSDADGRINRSVDISQNFETHSLVAVPMLGTYGKIIGVFEAINHHDGAFDPLDAEVLSDLSLHAAVAIESLRVKTKLTRSCDRLVDDAASSAVLIGRHASIEAVRQGVGKVAPSDLAVLIRGANGTGKEVLAKNIHFQSGRRHGPFVAVNCAALVESLLESELFGHEKGAFTDAQSARAGQFEMAHGGTLFLDEIGDMSPGGQAKLLRVLEEKVVTRVGGSQTIPVDVRVIAATNQPLETLIQEKRFREDLFFRLNVVPLTLPDLTDRGEDVLILAEHFLSQFRYQIGRADLHLGDDAKAALIRHPWPGNVRELRNTMERVCYLASDARIGSADLMLRGAARSPVAASSMDHPGGLADPGSEFPSDGSLSDATRTFQTHHIRGAIEAAGGNMTFAAENLGLHRSNLYRKMRQLGMPTSGE